MTTRDQPLYLPTGAALLRASVTPLAAGPSRWPDLSNAEDCRAWLADVWPVASEAVGLASFALAARIDQILSGHPATDQQLASVTATVIRYLLRSGGRPTPFGLFAGVAPVSFGAEAMARLGTTHRSVARADVAWLSEVINTIESGPLLPKLTVVFNTLASERAGKLIVPRAQGRAEIVLTAPVRVVRDAAREPMLFCELAEVLGKEFPDVAGERVTAMLAELVEQRFLLTSLRAPMTDTDPLSHLVSALQAAGAQMETASTLALLVDIHADIARLNEHGPTTKQTGLRMALISRMNRLHPQARSALSVDLHLDAEVQLPQQVASDMATAAEILVRLGPEPTGPAVWADYHRRFVERFGTGTVVPLTDVLNGASGLGYPAGYPRSVLPKLPETVTERDRRLLAAAWDALAAGKPLELTDTLINHITSGATFDGRFIAPHVEIAARIRATSLEAVQAGDYQLVITPARAAGTLSARFADLTTDPAMLSTYSSVPTTHVGAVPVQLCCPPRFVRGENVARLPVFLPEVLALGEPPQLPEGVRILRPHDLSLTATLRGLLLVDGDGRIIDPQVFHALALERQMPPLARFLAHVPRAYAAAIVSFDFGPAARELPHLPEVRRSRIVLAPERWHLTSADLVGENCESELAIWRKRTSAPELVELADGDMTLRLDLDLSAHVEILRQHLADKGFAILYRAAEPDAYNWIGHAHEVVAPVFRAGPGAPSGMVGPGPRRTSTSGHRPVDPAAPWISARIHTHPDAMDDIIAAHLPSLIAAVDGAPVWMVRYRNAEETDHLRIRVAAGGSASGDRIAALGVWAAALAETGVAGRIVIDTYFPEVGRYGDGVAMDAAEAVFCADTRSAISSLRQPRGELHPDTLSALSMLDIAEAFLGSLDAAADYFAGRVFTAPQRIDRGVTDRTTRLARLGIPRELDQLPGEVAEAWSVRAEALVDYRETLGDRWDEAAVLGSLLHLHFNRHRGIDRLHEGQVTRLARSAALAWRARRREVPA